MTTKKLTALIAVPVVAVAAACGVLGMNKYRNGEYLKLFRDEKVVANQLKAEEGKTSELKEARDKAKAEHDAKLAEITKLEKEQDEIVANNKETFKERKDYQRLQAEIDKLNKEFAPDKAKFEKAEAALKANEKLIEDYKKEQDALKKAKEEADKNKANDPKPAEDKKDEDKKDEGNKGE